MKIAANDLLALGYKPTDFLELPITKAFWESQFYKIDQTKGTSLLGYILYLEAIPVHCFKDVLGKLPLKGSKFLQVHMEEDPKHLEHVLEIIENLSKVEQDEIWQNFEQTAEMYQLMMLEIAKTEGRSVKAA